MPDLHVGLLYGGQSAEHDVSILSAKNVRAALGDRHRVTAIYITRDGRWLVGDSARLGADTEAGTAATFTPEGGASTVSASGLGALGLDVVFPVLHGHNGEDGTIQGFLHTLGIPFVGPDVLASAACMDKVVAKRILEAAGIPGTPYAVVHAHGERPSFETLTQRLTPPLFVKPANSGSSVGITRVTEAGALSEAFDVAFRYDKTVLVEQGVSGREIEVAVLGNERPEASVPGEIVLTSEYYDYDSKYEDPDASRMEVPADLHDDVAERIREVAVEAYAALGCEGLSRVDFFVTGGGDVLVNEINTIPGFTARSMYPVMWEQTGRPFPDVVDELIRLALARHERDRQRKTTR
ncbi:D-alanine--D-alanine ligase family protein [Rubrivirga marina]|uniref:D-alanine--D-alanine ligase n=1 Tax=Rubrivirga marina TaxID=1196024 RepID=A0A271J2Z6_9BACT|nr:D-alanine--D-alanine ligase family protein [Rubrivirga marina]PAP77720.1 D-alanine--D-alanine ligase A [Rubrivirga marina]